MCSLQTELPVEIDNERDPRLPDSGSGGGACQNCDRKSCVCFSTESVLFWPECAFLALQCYTRLNNAVQEKHTPARKAQISLKKHKSRTESTIFCGGGKMCYFCAFSPVLCFSEKHTMGSSNRVHGSSLARARSPLRSRLLYY